MIGLEKVGIVAFALGTIGFLLFLAKAVPKLIAVGLDATELETAHARGEAANEAMRILFEWLFSNNIGRLSAILMGLGYGAFFGLVAFLNE